jgi:hypothetical protein
MAHVGSWCARVFGFKSAARAITNRRPSLLTHPTLDLLCQLGLNGMAKAFGEIEASSEATTLTHPEWLALLLDQEASYRREPSSKTRRGRLDRCA